MILGRKNGEVIHLGNNITIKVIEVIKGVVKLGIEAPKDVLVLRGELKERIKESNKKANIKVKTREIKDLSRLLKK